MKPGRPKGRKTTKCIGRCDCGREAYKIKSGELVCKKCDDIERMGR